MKCKSNLWGFDYFNCHICTFDEHTFPFAAPTPSPSTKAVTPLDLDPLLHLHSTLSSLPGELRHHTQPLPDQPGPAAPPSPPSPITQSAASPSPITHPPPPSKTHHMITRGKARIS